MTALYGIRYAAARQRCLSGGTILKKVAFPLGIYYIIYIVVSAILSHSSPANHRGSAGIRTDSALCPAYAFYKNKKRSPRL